MDNKDVRWKKRFQNYQKAFLLLERTLQIKNPSEAEKGGLIHFYERTFDLSWRLMKDYLEEQGLIVNTPREAIKRAFQSGVVENGQEWIEALEDRDLTMHTYDEIIAEKVVATIRSSYFPILCQLYYRLEQATKS